MTITVTTPTTIIVSDSTARGPIGNTPNITIGTVTTGAPGSSASASVSGNSANVLINLTIPRGNTGNTGATGPANPEAYDQANAAYGQANAAYGQANAAYGQANNAYAAANLKLNLTGGTVTGSLNVSGNIGIGTTSPNRKLEVNDGAIQVRKDFSLSSTEVTIAEGTGIMLVVRDTTNGGTAILLYENGETPIIVSQSGSNYTTSVPSGTQIQFKDKSGNQGINAVMASGQSTTLRVSAYICDHD